MLVDSHCHFDMLDGEPSSFISRANANEVVAFLTIGVDITRAHEITALTQYAGVYAAVGQHPTSAFSDHAKIFDILVELSKHEKVLALGETGLDYYKDYGPDPAVQMDSFEAHIEASMRTNLPLVIHCRNAERDVINALRRYPGVKFVMHCFSGDINFANECLELGGYISFSGVLTFRNAHVTQEVCKLTPLDRILIETDSPYLAPEPHRGQKNEPAFVRLIAERAAQLRGITLREFGRATTENFCRLMGLSVASLLGEDSATH